MQPGRPGGPQFNIETRPLGRRADAKSPKLRRSRKPARSRARGPRRGSLSLHQLLLGITASISGGSKLAVLGTPERGGDFPPLTG